MAERFQYKKLPGHRRGFLRGASVWLGPDHLLLVRSLRFREEYKRYYFRDIQAIVMATAPRFHISTRAAVLGWLWLIAFSSVSGPARRVAFSWATEGLWALAAVLVIAWLVFSAFFSCRCRIFTAVSADDLPSLYRTWTAHRFLRRVQPLIEQAQGALDPARAETVASPVIGPTEPSLPEPVSPPPRNHTRKVSVVFAVLTASLFADAIFSVLTLHSRTGWSQTVDAVITLIEAGTAIAVIVHHYRGRARGAMQKLAIATLVVIGIFFYGQTIVASVTAGVQASANGQRAMLTLPFNSSVREIGAALAAVFGVVGVVIMLAGPEASKDTIIYPSA
jgi:hypothetical protein